MAYKRIDWDQKSLDRLSEEQDKAKAMFKSRRTGQQLFEANAEKLFTPITNKITTENEKNIEETKEVQKSVNNLAREIESQLPHYRYFQEIQGKEEAEASPTKEIDVDRKLDEQDRKNLKDMGLVLPSLIQFNTEALETMLKQIKTWNRQIGQYLRPDSKKSKEEREEYTSQKKTLEKYKEILNIIEKGRPYVFSKGEGIRNKKLVKQKQSRGRPKKYPKLILYNNPDHLAELLEDYIAAKEAGNTGVDNYIIDMLDELLRLNTIQRNQYDEFYKIYFPDYIK